MRVVLDANVAIAAAATRGLCEAVLELCIERHRIVLCRGILDEIEDKLRHKLRIPRAIVADYVKYLEGNAQVFEPAPIDSPRPTLSRFSIATVFACGTTGCAT